VFAAEVVWDWSQWLIFFTAATCAVWLGKHLP
jgi:hypothetical protein